MQKSFRTTLILAGLLILACVWYFVYEQKLKPQNSEAEEKAKQLITLEKDQIQEIDIDRLTNAPPDVDSVTSPKAPETPKYEKIKLRKTGGDWNLAEPVQAMADASAVLAMLNTLTSTKQERVIEDKPKDLVPFGLQNPNLRILVRKDASSPAQEVDLGKKTPTGFSAYAKIGGKAPVYRVPFTLRSTFDKKAKEFRDKNVLNLARYDVSEAEIQGPTEDLILKKDDKDNWTLARDNFPADNNEWNKTLNAIVDLKATDFVSDDGKNAEQYGLTSPEVKISLTKGRDKSRIALWLARADGKVYAKRQDKLTIFQVDKDILDKVERPSTFYRNMQLAIFNRFDVTRVKLERGSDVLELMKENGNWSLPTDPKFKVDNAKVDGLLTSLQDIKILKFAKSPLKQPELTIRLLQKQEKDKPEVEKLSLGFGKIKAGEVAVDRSGLAFPFTIKEADFRKVDLRKSAFLAPPPKEELKKDKKDDTKKG